MVETGMWLLTFAIASVGGLYFFVRAGLKWTWGLCLQQVIVLSAALLGAGFLFAPVYSSLSSEVSMRWAHYFAWLSGIMFLGFSSPIAWCSTNS